MMKSCSTMKAVFFEWRMKLQGESQARNEQQADDKPKKEVSPANDLGGHDTLLRVQVGRGLVDQVNVYVQNAVKAGQSGPVGNI